MINDKTVRQFLVKKFPTNEYISCPIPEKYWELFDEYAQSALAAKEKELDEARELLYQAKQELDAECNAAQDITDFLSRTNNTKEPLPSPPKQEQG